ncbi:hypothetical protein niasHT_013894 [Heterodera trifolii]|uniref:Uncharacterized protein n=1 Tax=Heterodera trifolii TaxID=157864 RepID=A0ABD2KTU4_9BILA
MYYEHILVHDLNTWKDNETGQQCVETNTNDWMGNADNDEIYFQHIDGMLIGFVTIIELRQTKDLELLKMKKLYFKKERKSYFIFALHGTKVLFNEKAIYDRLELKNYVDIYPIQWGQLNGSDVITFQISGGEVVGSATVQLLRETDASASVIDFSQGVRHYYRDGNGGLHFTGEKRLYFPYYRENFHHISASHGEQCIFIDRPVFDGSHMYLAMNPIIWDQKEGNDVITFKNHLGLVVGSATVESLREIDPIIDFSKGFRHYFRNEFAQICLIDEFDLLYCNGGNCWLRYIVDANGMYYPLNIR